MHLPMRAAMRQTNANSPACPHPDPDMACANAMRKEPHWARSCDTANIVSCSVSSTLLLHILLEKLAVEVVADGVVDEALLLARAHVARLRQRRSAHRAGIITTTTTPARARTWFRNTTSSSHRRFTTAEPPAADASSGLPVMATVEAASRAAIALASACTPQHTHAHTHIPQHAHHPRPHVRTPAHPAHTSRAFASSRSALILSSSACGERARVR
jgi:hypothetical protein